MVARWVISWRFLSVLDSDWGISLERHYRRKPTCTRAEWNTNPLIMTTTTETIPSLVKTESSREERPLIVGSDVPRGPFPIALSGPVQRGFGRGGKDLGCPTGRWLIHALIFLRYLNTPGEYIANLPDESLPAMRDVTQTGVYYGYAQIYPPSGGPALHPDDAKVLPMVMSLGWNPFYMNERMTAVGNWSIRCY